MRYQRARNFCIGITALALLAVTSWALADQRSPEDIISGRRSNLRDLGSAFKELGEELKKKKPMEFMVQQYVAQIGDLAQQEQNWFPAGTGQKTGIETHAKDEIWARPEDFSKAMQAFQREAGVLTGIAASDADALKAQHRKLGVTCKGCHDTFREKED